MLFLFHYTVNKMKVEMSVTLPHSHTAYNEFILIYILLFPIK